MPTKYPVLCKLMWWARFVNWALHANAQITIALYSENCCDISCFTGQYGLGWEGGIWNPFAGPDEKKHKFFSPLTPFFTGDVLPTRTTQPIPAHLSVVLLPSFLPHLKNPLASMGLVGPAGIHNTSPTEQVAKVNWYFLFPFSSLLHWWSPITDVNASEQGKILQQWIR